MAKIYGNTLATTMNPNRFQGSNGGSGGGITENEVEEILRMFADTVVSVKADKNDVYTKIEHEESVGRVIDGIVFPAIAKKAENDLSNVSNEAFLAKLNEVLPNGDEVSY